MNPFPNGLLEGGLNVPIPSGRSRVVSSSWTCDCTHSVRETARRTATSRTLKRPHRWPTDNNSPISTLLRFLRIHPTFQALRRGQILNALIGVIACSLLYSASALAVEVPESVVVQVGAYTVEANARDAMITVKRAGYPVLSDSVIDSQGRTVFRVMVGPYSTRERAESNLIALKAQGLDGFVRAYEAPSGGGEQSGAIITQLPAEEYKGNIDLLVTETAIGKDESELPTAEGDARLPRASERTTVNNSEIALLLERGLWAYQKGDSVHAAQVFAQAVQLSIKSGDLVRQVDAMMFLSDAYHSLDLNKAAIEVLQAAFPLAEKEADPARLAKLYLRLGNTHQSLGQYEDAKYILNAGIELARSAERPDLSAAIWNDLGNAYASLGELPSAISAFERSKTLAEDTGNQRLATRAGINLTRTSIERGERKDLDALLNGNLRAIEKISDPRERVQNLLAVGSLYRTAQERFNGTESWRKSAYDVFRQALALAQENDDQRAVSYAFGYLGRLYGDEGRYDEAMQYTRKATFAAQQINAYESLYQWEWQIARMLSAQGKTEDAIVAYRQAIGTLEIIRQDLIDGTGEAFAKNVGPVYLEFADLLLARSATITDQEANRQALIEVRSTLEQAKLAEIEDYFQHPCSLPVQESTSLDQLSPGTAIIYTVLLPERTELLVTLPSGLTQFSSQVGAKELTEVVRRFRTRIDVFSKDQAYLGDAKKLYDWLVQPLEGELRRQGVHTLVFVSDGVLRSIPMAALHDGQNFLIDKYAIATTLGLTLTSPHPIDRDDLEVLAYGITDSVQGFPPLPFVSGELTRISELYPATVFKNKDFVLAAAEKEMSEGSYSIVHIASHAQFDRDPQKSFVLTYDDKLTMNQLEQSVGLRRFQDDPLQLLVLSACQTAAGDDRSALGLAGIALKAGARSALATLWSVNDAATAVVVTEFYRQLQDRNVSKALALRNAQLMLARNKGTDHPSLWAAFLLIGNWL